MEKSECGVHVQKRGSGPGSYRPVHLPSVACAGFRIGFGGQNRKDVEVNLKWLKDNRRLPNGLCQMSQV